MIVKLKFDQQIKPGQTMVRVWMGDVNLPFRMAGMLMFTNAEWPAFCKLVKDGALFKSSVLIISEEGDGSSRELPKISPT